MRKALGVIGALLRAAGWLGRETTCENRVRISPAIYNNAGDIERLPAALGLEQTFWRREASLKL